MIKVSLVISTYNWKEALYLSLISVSRQTILPYEVIIADDGSRQDTAEMLRQIKPHLHTEQAARAGAGAVHGVGAFVQNLLECVVILLHFSVSFSNAFAGDSTGSITFKQHSKKSADWPTP